MRQRFAPTLGHTPESTPTVESSPSSEDAAPAKPLYELKELKDLGGNLPVGFSNPASRTRVRTFRCRKFRLKEEKELARLKDNAKGMTIGKFVSGVLETMMQTIGPHNFDTMKEPEKQLAVAQLHFADVLYMYLYLRYDALGPDEPVVMRITCPNCRTPFTWYGDLGSMEVNVAREDAIDLRIPYKLKDGIMLRGEMRYNLKVQPLMWHSFLRPEFSDAGKREQAVLQFSIASVEGIPEEGFNLADNELDELTKFDMAGLSQLINDNSPGPQLAIHPECPGCKFTPTMMLDWGYDNFFSRSARPNRGTS